MLPHYFTFDRLVYGLMSGHPITCMDGFNVSSRVISRAIIFTYSATLKLPSMRTDPAPIAPRTMKIFSLHASDARRLMSNRVNAKWVRLAIPNIHIKDHIQNTLNNKDIISKTQTVETTNNSPSCI